MCIVYMKIATSVIVLSATCLLKIATFCDSSLCIIYCTLCISVQAQLTSVCTFCDSSVCISLRAQLSQHFRESTALYISLLVICNVSAKSSYQDISHVKESAVFTTRVLEPFGHWNLVHVGPEEGLA